MTNNLLGDFKKLLEIKRYSKQTISSYLSHLNSIYKFFGEKPFEDIKDKELVDYILQQLEQKTSPILAKGKLLAV